MLVRRQRTIEAIDEVSSSIAWQDDGRQARGRISNVDLWVQDGSVSMVRNKAKSVYVLYGQEDMMSFVNELKRTLGKA